MNDKQLAATILLVITAFVFWLYNTNKLAGIANLITGAASDIPHSGGFDYNTGYNEHSTDGSFGSDPYSEDNYGGGSGTIKSLPPLPSVGTPGTIKNGATVKPVVPQPARNMWGDIIRDSKGNPVYYAAPTSFNDMSNGSTGLEYASTLNRVAVSVDNLLQYLPTVPLTMPNSLEGLFA